MQVPAPFDYVRATSVANVLELLERHGPESRVVAGGHSLLPMMKLRLARPDWLIDINDVAELRHITEEPDVLRVGALTRHAALLDRNPDPDEGEIREAISGQICRCTGYATIVSSVHWAADHERAARAGDSEAPETVPAGSAS